MWTTELLRKYNEGTLVLFPLRAAGSQDFLTSPPTFATGDVKISQAGGAPANTNNLPAHVGGGIYSLTLAAAEMSSSIIAVTIIDQTTPKVWDDQVFFLITFGHASAALAFDLDKATQDVNAIQISSSTAAADSVEANIGNLNATVSSRSSHAAADIWSAATRTLTAFGFNVTVATNNDKTGYSLSAAGVQAIWDALTSALTTASSIGKLLVDNINAAVSSRSSHSAADVWAVSSRTLTSSLDPTAAQIADAVWDEAKAGHTAAGSFGEEVQAHALSSELPSEPPTAAAIADQVWDEAKAGHVAAGSFGEEVQAHALSSEVAALNDLSAAEVNAEVDQALADYNGPTHAELIAEIDAVQADIVALNDPSAAEIWAHPSRSLTQTAAEVEAAVDGSALNVTRAATFDATLTGLSIPATWQKIYFTVKVGDEDDDEAMLQILKSNPADPAGDGLIVLKGAAGTKAQGSLTVNQAGGTIAIHLADNATAALALRAGSNYDLKVLTNDGESSVLTGDLLNVVSTPTETIG